MSISSILEQHHHTIDENQKFEFLRDLEEQCRDMASATGSHGTLVRLSEALREGEAQLRERARKALQSVDSACVQTLVFFSPLLSHVLVFRYTEQTLSAIEQEYRQRLESEFIKELEEESKRMREEMRRTFATQEERCVSPRFLHGSLVLISS